MIHYFNVDIATKYGIEEAIIIQNFAFWIGTNTANKVHFHDGRYWTYNSMDAMNSLFPEIKKVRYIIDKLISAGILMKGNFNKAAFDRTTWYAFTDDGLTLLREHNIDKSICQNWQMQSPKLANPSAEIGKPIPDIYTDNNSSTTTARAKDEVLSDKERLFSWVTDNEIGLEQTLKQAGLLTHSATLEEMTAIVEPYVEDFYNNLQMSGKEDITTRGRSEVKSHFSSWLRKRIEIDRQQQNNNSNGNSQSNGGWSPTTNTPEKKPYSRVQELANTKFCLE